jgi:uncharacterized protein YlaI
MQNKCIKCASDISPDDIGATKKLINRGITEFMCIPCLAEKFGITEEKLREKIEQWRESGCLLFVQHK